jgi:hypothetical protein
MYLKWIHNYKSSCFKTGDLVVHTMVQCVPLATEPGISLIILTPMKILQRNLNRSTFVVREMKRNVSVVRFKFRWNILISGKIIEEMPGSVASGKHCISWPTHRYGYLSFKDVLTPMLKWSKAPSFINCMHMDTDISVRVKRCTGKPLSQTTTLPETRSHNPQPKSVSHHHDSNK